MVHEKANKIAYAIKQPSSVVDISKMHVIENTVIEENKILYMEPVDER